MTPENVGKILAYWLDGTLEMRMSSPMTAELCRSRRHWWQFWRRA